MKQTQRMNENDDGDVSQAVQELIKFYKRDDYSVLNKLRQKYKDEDLVEKIFDGYKIRKAKIQKKADRFRQLIWDKYGAIGLSHAKMMGKAKKYADRYNLSDDEFELFFKYTITDKRMPEAYRLPITKMSKALGYGSMMATAGKLKVKPEEMGDLQLIAQLHASTKPLHSQVVLQSLSYNDCAPEAINSVIKVDNYATDRKNYYSYVHPIIAALFFPKVKLLDELILIANIGSIVNRKHRGLQINTKPDFELYNNFISDPNDSACTDLDSPIKDLYIRFALQAVIWDSVLKLRQGQYYNDRLASFLHAIENCRSNVYDAPDLTYVKDEGTILRRLLSAFSLRPTMVSTSRLQGLSGNGMQGQTLPGSSLYGYAINPLSQLTNVTTVPMITLRLPYNFVSSGNTKTVKLGDALQQAQWYVENGMIVPKSQQIIHSRGVLFFYVGRRFQSINISRLRTQCNFNQLPMTIAGWETINRGTVSYDQQMQVMNDKFVLRSVVMVETLGEKKNLVVGSSAGIFKLNGTSFVYNPQAASTMDVSGNRGQPITNMDSAGPMRAPEGPIEAPEGLVGGGCATHEQLCTKAATAGTIFMYQKVSEGDCQC